MTAFAPRIQAAPAAPAGPRLPPLNPALLTALTFAACVGVGVLMAYNLSTGIGVLIALCYLPLVLLNLPLGIALWVPTTFLTALPGFDTASHAAGILIAIAWLGTLRRRARESDAPVPRRLLLVLALFVVWLTLSLLWAERPDLAFKGLQPYVAAALVFTVLMTLDLTRQQIRVLAFSFLAGVTISVALGLILGVQAPSSETAIFNDGRLRGGLDDPNYLAAGIVPSIALAAGLVPGVRSFLGRIGLAGSVVILVLGLAATQSRGGFMAAAVAIAVALVVAKRGRIVVVAFVAIIVGLVAIWFASSPTAWKRVSHTADQGNGRGSLWTVAIRIFKDHPVTGVGVENYSIYSPRYAGGPGKLTFVTFIAEKPHVVHNVYLQLAVETGLVGLGLFLTIVASALAAAMRAARRYERRGDYEDAALSRAVFVAVLAGLAASTFISNANGFQIWVLLAFGPLLWRNAQREPEPAPVASPRAEGRLIRPAPAWQA